VPARFCALALVAGGSFLLGWILLLTTFLTEPQSLLIARSFASSETRAVRRARLSMRSSRRSVKIDRSDIILPTADFYVLDVPCTFRYSMRSGSIRESTLAGE
jgi:hypothetical protein